MNRAYVLSPSAQRDLDEMWYYTCASWGKERADAYVGLIRSALLSIATFPHLGRDCVSVRAGYKKYPSGSHMLFYRLIDNGIDVIRILHQNMDTDRHI
jgi:toxin ParE1/3/4